MPVLLSDLQQQRLDQLQVALDPDATWKLRVDRGSAGIQHLTMDWITYPVAQAQRLLAQRLLLDWWSPAVINGNTTIKDNAYRQADTLLRLLALADEHYPGRALCELDQADWVKLVVLMIFRIWNSNEAGERSLVATDQPLAVQRLESTITVLNRWLDSYQTGNVNDGPDCKLTSTSVEKALKTELKAFGTDLDAWKQGGSYGAVPFVLAHLLLGDALDTLHALRTKQLLAYFTTVREHNAHNLVSAFWSGCASAKPTQLWAYRASGNISALTVSRESGGEDSDINRAKAEIAKPLHTKLRALQAEHAPDIPFTFPWQSYTDLLADYNALQGALYIIFLSVMGKRGPSEVRTLRGIDITRPDAEAGQEAVMRPSIEKTNQGLRETQGVTNFIDDGFEVLLQLGYHDKTGTNLPLFSALPPLLQASKTPTRMSIWSASDRLHTYYTAFCDRVAEKVDFNVQEMHTSITSHQFRHSFAEFALRKFDGNVEELIRQHFCHAYNHWWTRRYTGDKLDAQDRERINRRYVRELVPRIVYDHADDPDFVGGVATFMKQEFTDKVRILSPEQTEAHIESLCDEVIQVTAHEYGFCLLLKRFRSMANCADENGNPNPAGTSMEKCKTCPNFCASRKSHLTKHQVTVISHADFIEQKTMTLPILKESSRQAIRNSVKLFPELAHFAEGIA
ncbi:hypothetical protein [Vibrio sp. McD22-P3]|uniref:hypothetical protein n=1 Tax=Vibrio sp. McD22-P3 TaxID=2724880 RepID=UPI001F461FC0|nr:hypothetical protein [Vibrio sp. McD22-P3]MCF4176349.1 hypothetical protein [Vibrio sp. McD22-P3]